MARTPEGKVKAAITKLLKIYVDRDRLMYWMPVPSGYGVRTTDYIGCHKGKFFAIEAKRPGGTPTATQELFLERVDNAGGVYFVIDGDSYDDLLELRHWLDRT